MLERRPGRMGREPRFLPDGVRIRAMSESEVGAFVAYLEQRAEKYWALHLEAEEKSHVSANGFKLEAKTLEDVERALLWLLAGCDPNTGEKARVR
jgi:hypothetical protein